VTGWGSARDPLHVVQLSVFRDPAQRAPQALLEGWPSLVDIATAAARGGARVTLIQAASEAARLQRAAVDYEFVPASAARPFTAEPALAQRLRELAPDILHLHGLGFPEEILALRRICPDTPLLLQDHASKPPALWRRPQWRRAWAGADGVSFCARAQAEPFRRRGLLRPGTPVYEIPESTSHFTPGDQAAARRACALGGQPCLLWVGHLDANKDPLTVLAGVSEASRSLPQLQLFCYFGTAPLREAVTRRIAADPQLRGRVHLRGAAPHALIEQAMRGADLFVLGSHREGSGYALLEALACGLPPLVSDIPSFRALTAGGAVGALWRCGDASALAAALRRLSAPPPAALRAAVRAHFERELSSVALGRKLVAAYAELAACRRAWRTRA